MDKSWQYTDRDHVIDTRSIVAHMADMQAEQWNEQADEVRPMYRWPEDRRAEYRAYEDILAEVRQQSGDAELTDNRGTVLIREDRFTWWIKEETEDTYGGDLYAVKEINGQPEVLTWSEVTDRFPFDHIDWEAAADEQRSHYGELTFGEHVYLFPVEWS